MKQAFSPFVHSFPAPAVLIGCGTVQTPNLITCSWFGTVCSEPPMVSVSIRKSRHSYGLVHDSGEFTVNIPRGEDLKLVQFCGTASGRDVNKFSESGLRAIACPPLAHAPMIDGFPLVLGCRVRRELELGSHCMFIAEVVSVYGEPRAGIASRRPDFFCERQIAYLDGKYWTLRPLPE